MKPTTTTTTSMSMRAIATMRQSMRHNHSLQQLQARNHWSCRCLLSSSPLPSASHTNNGNINSSSSSSSSAYTARRRITSIFQVHHPFLLGNSFSSFKQQQQQQQQQCRWFGSTPFFPLSSRPTRSYSNASSSLVAPTVVYSDNHLLAINKPAGWHSVPNIPKKKGRKGVRGDNNNNYNNNNDDDDGAAANTNSISRKCLLTHLQGRRLGGGSNRDFLLPLHRIDQPCTGVLLFGKTSKAASRITTVWKGKAASRITTVWKGKKPKKNKGGPTARGVSKDYLCVVPTPRLAAMEEVSVAASLPNDHVDGTNAKDKAQNPGFTPATDGAAPPSSWNRLDGLMLRQSASSSPSEMYGRNNHHRWQQQKYYETRRGKGKSVRIVQWRRRKTGAEERTAEAGHGDKNDKDKDDAFYDYAMVQPVSVHWRTVDVPGIDPACTLLLVRTSQGARHMVRALLAQVGNCPVVGDLRYWTAPKRRTTSRSRLAEICDDGTPEMMMMRNENDSTQRDKGPLPDRSVALHAYGVYFDARQLQLGSLDTFEFRAPVPPTWKAFFGIDDKQIQTAL
eukprot:jgi/Psemu1/15758/gm1.15758_g